MFAPVKRQDWDVVLLHQILRHQIAILHCVRALDYFASNQYMFSVISLDLTYAQVPGHWLVNMEALIEQLVDHPKLVWTHNLISGQEMLYKSSSVINTSIPLWYVVQRAKNWCKQKLSWLSEKILHPTDSPNVPSVHGKFTPRLVARDTDVLCRPYRREGCAEKKTGIS